MRCISSFCVNGRVPLLLALLADAYPPLQSVLVPEAALHSWLYHPLLKPLYLLNFLSLISSFSLVSILLIPSKSHSHSPLRIHPSFLISIPPKLLTFAAFHLSINTSIINMQDCTYRDPLTHKNSNEGAISSPQSEEEVRKTTFTKPSKTNFIKSVKAGMIAADPQAICIYEDEPFAVQIIHLEQLVSASQPTGVLWPQPTNAHDRAPNMLQINFQTVPYDCCQISHQHYAASSRGMPLRVYRQDGQSADHVGTITDRKQNSEKYLSPIQIAFQAETHGLAGAGQKFVSIYDTEKLTSSRIPYFDKISLSSVEWVQGTLAVGSFEGNLFIVDPRTPGAPVADLKRPHVDSITTIGHNPAKPFQFSTNARKDDYTYTWDLRHLQGGEPGFLRELKLPKQNNQRISFCYSPDGNSIVSGSEFGQIIKWNLVENSVSRLTIDDGTSVVNSVAMHSNESVTFSTGSRVFEVEGLSKGNYLGMAHLCWMGE